SSLNSRISMSSPRMKSIKPMREMVAQIVLTRYIHEPNSRRGGLMKLRILFGAVTLAAVVQLNAWATTPCESLTSVKLTNAKVTAATVVAAGAFVPPGGAARGGGG